MKFKVTKNLITRLDSEMLTTKNVNSIECSFTFSDDYEGLELFAVFYRDSNTNCFVPLSGGKCIIPHEVLEDAGILCVGAYGVRNTESTVEKRITTNYVEIQVQSSLSSSASTPEVPTPDIWEQYIQEILGYKEAAQQAADTAEQYKNQAQEIKDSMGIEYDVQPNKVGFKKANESEYTYTDDLTGPKGDAPIKGVDYWTDSDKEEITNEVIDEFGTDMANFKKLGEVTLAENASDSANVLIEESGEIKRVPKTEVGGGGGDSAFFDITVTVDYSSGAVTADKTYEEILEKFQSGVTPRIRYQAVIGDVSTIAAYSSWCSHRSNENCFLFYLYDATFLPLDSDGRCSFDMAQITISSTDVKLIKNGVYVYNVEIADPYGIVMRSATAGSSKRFRIKVDDSGTISATEVL